MLAVFIGGPVPNNGTSGMLAGIICCGEGLPIPPELAFDVTSELGGTMTKSTTVGEWGRSAKGWLLIGRRARIGCIAMRTMGVGGSLTQRSKSGEGINVMQPKPELVVFLTDGVSGKDSDQIAKRMGDLASSRSIRVNTIALMEPKARKAMAELARRSGGEFSLIGGNGKKVK